MQQPRPCCYPNEYVSNSQSCLRTRCASGRLALRSRHRQPRKCSMAAVQSTRLSKGGCSDLAVSRGAPLLQLAPLGVGLLAQTLRPARAVRLLRLLRLAVLPHLNGQGQPQGKNRTCLHVEPGLIVQGHLRCMDSPQIGSYSNSLSECLHVWHAPTSKSRFSTSIPRDRTPDLSNTLPEGEHDATRRTWKPFWRAAALNPSATRLNRVTDNSARSESSATSFEERGTCAATHALNACMLFRGHMQGLIAAIPHAQRHINVC